MEFTAEIRQEDGSYWATVRELPGVFATGDTFDELLESVNEGVRLYLEDAGPVNGPLSVTTATLTDRPLVPA